MNAQFNYQRSWATYYGGAGTKLIDSEMENTGNIYIVGNVYGTIPYSNGFVTSNSQQPYYGGVNSDSFIAKYNSSGLLLWATYFGGSGNDELTVISIDSENNLFVVGSTNSSQNIATTGAFQVSLTSSGNSSYIVKYLSSDSLIWSTYFIDNTSITDIATDNDKNLIICDITSNTNEIATPDSFQKIYNTNAVFNSLIMKFSKIGQIIWGTNYVANNSLFLLFFSGICINSSGIYVSGKTPDFSGFYATLGCHQSQNNGGVDLFLTKFSLDCNRLWSTYY